MPPTVDIYAIRKKEFMEATRAFFFSIGYARMSVQMLTQKVGVAKGTFYHYFRSKEDLLTQWVLYEMSDTIQQQLELSQDPSLPALSKMKMVFEISRKWKFQHLDMITPLLRVLYDDHNLRLRTEMTKQSINFLGPIFEIIIKQGIQEGVFNTSYPEEMAYKLPKIFQSKKCSCQFPEYF